MLRYFRRRRPQHVQKITREDIQTAYAWDMSLTEWFALTDQERADKRFHLALAPKVVA